MAKRHLPLPRTWLKRQIWTGYQADYKNIALTGRFPSPGTKAYLRQALLSKGWSYESIERPAMRRSRSRMVDMRDLSKSDPDSDVKRDFKDLSGYPVSVIKSSESNTTRVSTLWDSYALNPWWLSANGGDRTLLMMSEWSARIESLSASFIYDVWSTLGSLPEHRPPSFVRINLLSLMSSDSINRFCEGPGLGTDLLVLHGGVQDEDMTHSNLGFVSALQDKFEGLIIFEAHAISPQHMDVIDRSARKSGFSNILGVV